MITFINNKICPFGARVWLTLEATGLPYTFKETPLAPGTKPSWFTAAYAKALGADPASDGKVPVLEDGPFSLTESLHCADYVCAKAGKLLPPSPADRARSGLFLEAVAKFVPPFYALLMKQTAEEQAAAKAQLLAALAALAAQLRALGGPFLLGAEASYADFMLYPFFERLVILEHYRGFRLDAEAAADAALAPLAAWRATMAQLPAAKATAQDPAFFMCVGLVRARTQGQPSFTPAFPTPLSPSRSEGYAKYANGAK